MKTSDKIKLGAIIFVLILVGLVIARAVLSDMLVSQSRQQLPQGTICFEERVTRDGVSGQVALSPDGRWLFRAHGSTVFSPVQGVR